MGETKVMPGPGKVQKEDLRRPHSAFALVRLMSVMCKIHKPGNGEGSPFLERRMYPLEDRAEHGSVLPGKQTGSWVESS